MLRATGTVVRIEQKPWNMEGRSGITRTVRLIVGDADFVDVKYPELDGNGQPVDLPRKGEAVDLAVVASAPGGRLSVTARGEWHAVMGEDVPARPLTAAK